MSIAFMSEAFGRTPMTAASTCTAAWMGRLKVKPGSRNAAESHWPPRD
jgi:hypothetical protein